MSSGTNNFFELHMLMVSATVDKKKGVLELGELEYHKKWYFPNYFRNSVSDPIISKINANGPFCPFLFVKLVTNVELTSELDISKPTPTKVDD